MNDVPSLEGVLKVRMPQIPETPPDSLIIKAPVTLPERLHNPTIRAVFDQFATYSKTRDEGYGRLRSFFTAIHSFSGFWNRNVGFVGDEDFLAPNVLSPGAKAAILPPEEAQTLVHQAAAADRFAMTKAVMDYMVRQVQDQRFGLIHWLREDVCQYYFFRYRVDYIELDTTRISEDEESVTYERVDHHSLHVHELMDAKRIPLHEYNGKLPSNVAYHLRNEPEWLKAQFEVVDGHQIGKSVTTREERRGTVQERRQRWEEAAPVSRPVSVVDPCILYGPFVLCGWEDHEGVVLSR